MLPGDVERDGREGEGIAMEEVAFGAVHHCRTLPHVSIYLRSSKVHILMQHICHNNAGRRE
jgi:hypothetical protein